ncbi:MAG: S1 RNA-binding domain-containing protein [Anaerolineae bacterium]|nr:S1 RNA-binding domain-containing protein [Anaerolineae bacterium]
MRMTEPEAPGTMTTEDFAALWEAVGDEYKTASPERGDILEGTIVHRSGGEILVDVGAKQEALVSSKDISRMSREELSALQIGSVVKVYVLRPVDREGNLLVSINLAKAQEDWITAAELMEEGEAVTVPIESFNKGGLVCRFKSLQGFIPMSQIANLARRTKGVPPPEGLEVFAGGELRVKIIEVNRRRRRLILSERAARREWRAQQREKLLEEIQVGEVRKGIVSSLRDFGAFVDLGGMDGLVHISELSWSHVDHPRDVLDVAQEIEVKVIRVDRERERIGLSLKELQPDPWVMAEMRFPVGSVVTGVVTHLVDFGAFAEIEPGIEGLVHISELADGTINAPSDVVSEGDELTLLVLNVDSTKHHLGLSLRQASAPQPEEDLEPSDEEEDESGPDVVPDQFLI